MTKDGKPSQRKRAKRAVSKGNVYETSSWFEVLQATDKSQTAIMTLKPGPSTGEEPEAPKKSQQILLLIDGELLGELDREILELKTGDTIIILPNVKHKFANRCKKSALTFNVYCPPEYPRDEKE
ncbi:MAG TPA: cupin domain-containing protein [Chthoniobacterales bacterium]|jgi:mannose-6-phosphate isomerase-like protein (cupin superfamily)|nr:cupin domain-containing protein [Chthoniobacterales bacterium]